MKHEDLPQRWKERVVEYLRAKGEENRERLSASEFSSQEVAKILFEDGSFAEFRYSLVIEEPTFSEVAVFTEHCGYHIFSSNAVTVTVGTSDPEGK